MQTLNSETLSSEQENRWKEEATHQPLSYTAPVTVAMYVTGSTQAKAKKHGFAITIVPLYHADHIGIWVLAWRWHADLLNIWNFPNDISADAMYCSKKFVSICFFVFLPSCENSILEGWNKVCIG